MALAARTCRSPVPPTPWRGFPKPAICGTAQHSPEPQGRQCGTKQTFATRHRRSACIKASLIAYFATGIQISMSPIPVFVSKPSP